MDIMMPPSMANKQPEEGLLEMQRYLFRLGEQLNYALGTLQTDLRAQENTLTGTVKTTTQIQESTQPETLFVKLKTLIIKSADIVDAYYELIRLRLEGRYTAQSDFGTFLQETGLQIEGSSSEITQKYYNVQQLISEELTSVRDVIAYIRTGKVAEDTEGNPLYGIELGQQTVTDGTQRFKAFTRLVANRLSFYDENDNEVAWISDRTMHVTSAFIDEMDAQKMIRTPELHMGEYTLRAGSDGHLTLM